MPIKILLADDHAIVRSGLRALLEKESDLEIIGEVEDGRKAVEMAIELRPNVVIMDISMPQLNGVEATRILLKEISEVKVIALSMYTERRFAAEMLAAGASGYVLKSEAFAELVQAIHSVMKGKAFLSPGIAKLVIDDYKLHLSKNESIPPCPLSHREREVLQLLAEGKSTKEMAAVLHISIKTIDAHRQQIMGRLGIHSVAELTKYAIREGLTSLDT